MSIDPQGPVRAPDLDGAVGWLNVDRPLSLKALRGKVVLLDFWTYGCINCIHIIPDLRRLEARYPAELVVIGVHSPKFTNERDTDNLRRILVRYEIEHPVANDAEFRIWRAYGARAWPTRVLVDPAGYVVGTASGEGNYEAFDRAIAAVVSVFDERGAMDRTPLRLSLERDRLPSGSLAFPGKVEADAARDRLYIADSNHNRVLVSALDGRRADVAGSGQPGRADGPFDRASFYRPQGIAVAGDALYVADTENHLIRRIDLARRQVSTMAGTGEQAPWGAEGGAALASPLSSPWDVALHGRLLFIAMAGLHQIWVLDLDRSLVFPYAGSGREARIDGTVDESAFSQPSGLAVAGDTLLVADSEANIIRAIELPPLNRVRTIAGGDLFEFGDRDGTGDDVRLQHPLGLAADGGIVYIADTYNHRIKRLEPASGRVQTLAGTGRPGAADGPAGAASFSEPGGLTLAGGRLYVADTNNHAIRLVDPATGETRTLTVES